MSTLPQESSKSSNDVAWWMPVHQPPDEDEVGPYRRLSHTQVDMHRRCPRMWYNRYIRGLLGPTYPIFAMGHAVEGALNRVMRDSPSLVPADAPSELFDSPLEPREDGLMVPSRNKEAAWPGPSLELLPQSDWPTSKDSLRAWAIARAEPHFEREWEACRQEWAMDPNREGDWVDFEVNNRERALEMVIAGIDFHLEEVDDCLEQNGGVHTDAWRAGEGRGEWPAPDGFPYDWDSIHPCAQESGGLSWCEAWELARPWFCDPDSDPFTLSAVHPEGWMQGEYDLVYRWDGTVRIFDVKASTGVSDFSYGYPQQLATYAYLWWVTHSKEEMPSTLEIWYLGVPARKSLDVPSVKALERLEARLMEKHRTLKMSDSYPIDDYPGKPAPVRSFLPGGIPSIETPEGGMARCSTCEYQMICEASPHSLELPSGGSARLSASSPSEVNCTKISEIDPFVQVSGTVRSAKMVKQWPNYERELLEFFLDFGPGSWVAVVVRKDDPDTPDGFIDGARVRIRGGIIASGWKRDLGVHLRLDVGARGTIEMAPEKCGDDVPFIDLHPIYYNIDAILFNFDHRDEKWGVRLVDDTGSTPFQVWGKDKASSILAQFEPGRGQRVLLTGAKPKDQHGRLVLEGRVTKTFTTRLRERVE